MLVWLNRCVAAFAPVVVPQGSFRYGTVVRPLVATQKYDLDNVTTLQIAKTRMSQRELKNLYGAEIKAYAIAHQMTDPVEERNLVLQRVFYADAFDFHLDSLPCVPEDQRVMEAIVGAGVPAQLARLAVAITDPAPIRSMGASPPPRSSAAIREGSRTGLNNAREAGLFLA